MSRFHRLTVARVERETHDAVAITFAVPPALAEAFRFAPGQHVTLRADLGGADVRRSYSICSAVQDGTLRVAVKHCAGGVFSRWANESLRAGDALDVTPPLGHFGLPLDAAQARHYVGFAAGSGITPLLSIVATTLATEPASTFTLVYANRTSATVMFREELADLKDRYLARFALVHVLSREAQDSELMHGRIDRARADAIIERWVPVDDIAAAYVCGPSDMMEAVVAALSARGVPEARIRVERFAASIPRHEHVAPAVRPAGAQVCTVTATLDGAQRTFTVARGTQTVLAGGLASGIELPYSCKGGVCSTCRCRVLEGEVDMDVNFALEADEVAQGYVLACQSYPRTDRLRVTYDT